MQLFAHPELIDITLFATPGISFSGHRGRDRPVREPADCLYVVDCPILALTRSE
jgi:hypothetical protein